MNSFRLKIKLLFVGCFILDDRMKLRQLAEDLLWGLTDQKLPWRGLPQAVYGGNETPTDTAGWQQCSGHPDGVSSSASPPGPAPFPLKHACIPPMFPPWVTGWSLP